jgi:hypothetical protein
MILSVLGLLLTLALVGWIAKQQMRALKVDTPSAAAAASAALDSRPAGNQVQQVKSQVEQSLAQGVAAQASAAQP